MSLCMSSPWLRDYRITQLSRRWGAWTFTGRESMGRLRARCAPRFADARGDAHSLPPRLSLLFVGLRSAVYSLYERRLRAQVAGHPVPQHVAVMLDGNRRWARAAGFEDVSEGHL